MVVGVPEATLESKHDALNVQPYRLLGKPLHKSRNARAPAVGRGQDGDGVLSNKAYLYGHPILVEVPSEVVALAR